MATHNFQRTTRLTAGSCKNRASYNDNNMGESVASTRKLLPGKIKWQIRAETSGASGRRGWLACEVECCKRSSAQAGGWPTKYSYKTASLSWTQEIEQRLPRRRRWCRITGVEGATEQEVFGCGQPRTAILWAYRAACYINAGIKFNKRFIIL